MAMSAEAITLLDNSNSRTLKIISDLTPKGRFCKTNTFTAVNHTIYPRNSGGYSFTFNLRIDIDFIREVYVCFEVLNKWNIPDFGRSIIDCAELYIGGVNVQKIDGQFMHIREALSQNPRYTNYNMKTMMIQLPFSFSSQIDYSLPLKYIYYQDVNIDVCFKKLNLSWLKRFLDEPIIPDISSIIYSYIDKDIKIQNVSLLVKGFEEINRYCHSDSIYYINEQIFKKSHTIKKGATFMSIALQPKCLVKEIIWIFTKPSETFPCEIKSFEEASFGFSFDNLFPAIIEKQPEHFYHFKQNTMNHAVPKEKIYTYSRCNDPESIEFTGADDWSKLSPFLNLKFGNPLECEYNIVIWLRCINILGVQGGCIFIL